MDSLFSALVLALMISVSLFTPSWLLVHAAGMQNEFDLFLIQTDACRSPYDAPRVRSFRFAAAAPRSCLLRRGDYDAPGTDGRWPYALCVLITSAGTPQPQESVPQCDYR